MSHARVIARNSFWTFLETIASMLSTIVCSIAVARVLGPVKHGHYNYVLWIASIFGTMAAFGVPVATRKYAAEYLGKGSYAVARAIVRATFKLQAGMSVVVVSGGLAVVFTQVATERQTYAALAVLSLLPQLLYSIPAAAINAAEDVSWNVRAALVGSLVNTSGVGLSLVAGWGITGLTATLLVSRIVDFCLRYRFYRMVYAGIPDDGVRVRLPAGLRKRMIRFCTLSTILLALDAVVWNRSEILFLERFSAIQEVAFFSLSYGILQQVLTLPRVLAWSTETTMLVQQGRAPETVAHMAVTSMRLIALFSIPACFGLAALAGPLLQILYGAQYSPAIPVLTVLALFGVGPALLLPAEYLLVTTENQGILLRWGIVLAIVNLLASFALIPPLGALGAGIAKGSVQVLASVGLWAFIRVRFRVALPIALLGKLFVIAALMLAAVLALGWYLPALATIVLGIPLGIFVVVPLLRLLRCLDPADGDRLLTLQRMIPRPLRAPYGALVRIVTSPTRGQ